MSQIKTHLCFFIALLVYIQSPAATKEELLKANLRPFTSDGCSSSPDGIKDNEFLNCCLQHDLAYWKGGTEVQRSAADSEFKSCLQHNTSESITLVYFNSVRIGGSPSLDTDWVWGYGWSPLREYGDLSLSEQQLIQQNTPNLSLPVPLINTYTRNKIITSQISSYIEEKLQWKPHNIGEVYGYAQMNDSGKFARTEVEPAYYEYAVTGPLCPHGYYIVQPKIIMGVVNKIRIKSVGCEPDAGIKN